MIILAVEIVVFGMLNSYYVLYLYSVDLSQSNTSYE